MPPDPQRKATRATLGKASLSSSNRLPSRSGAMMLSPVIFPPGRARLETSPVPTGSAASANTMGIVALAFLAAKIARAGGDDDVNFETDQFGCKVRQPFEFPFCISVLNDNVFPFDIAKLAQPLAKCFDPGRNERTRRPRSEFLSGEFSPAAAPRPQPHTLRVRAARVTNPTHFRFLILRILDYRIEATDVRFSESIFVIVLIPPIQNPHNRKSKMSS